MAPSMYCVYALVLEVISYYALLWWIDPVPLVYLSYQQSHRSLSLIGLDNPLQPITLPLLED